MRFRPRRTFLFLCSFVIALAFGCARTSYAPIEHRTLTAERTQRITKSTPGPRRSKLSALRPVIYIVTKGDTLHAVAWRYRIDYRDLVKWNGLSNPDLIFIGQKLRLRMPPRPAASSKPTSSKKSTANKAVSADAKSAKRILPSSPVSWVWPTQGKTRHATTVSGSKGIEIHGAKGQAVTAAAPGTVVYSGSGLRGYGELIIIKHNDTFLSAYAHNDMRLVPEGRRVNAGEMIARMGDTDAKDVMLHFEIRRNGKAVDPLKYLPKR